MSKLRWAAAIAAFLFIAGAEAASQEEGDYSVLVLANVDDTTASDVMDKLVAAGYEEFVKTGSAGEGYDVHMPGLSLEDAQALAAEVKKAIGFAPRAWETAKLP